MTLRNTHAIGSLVLAAAALGGCASEPATVQADNDAPVCTRVYPIGSNLPTTRCVTAQQAAEERRQFDQNTLHTPNGIPRSAGGG